MSVLGLSKSGTVGRFWPCIGEGLFIPSSITTATTDIHPCMNYNAMDGWDNGVRLLGIGVIQIMSVGELIAELLDNKCKPLTLPKILVFVVPIFLYIII